MEIKQMRIKNKYGNYLNEQVQETSTNIEKYKLIETEISEPIEDIEVKELITKIQEEKKLTEENFSFFYFNVTKNTYYYYNQDKYYTAASTIKVPLAMIYYDKVNRGEIELDDKLIYESGCYEEGNGLTTYKYNIRDYIPIEFLLQQSIVNSDNTAANILIKDIGNTEYRKEIATYANGIELPNEFYNSNVISANYAYNVLKTIYENSDSYQELIENMKISSGGEYLKKEIEQYEVAHKYGSYEGNVHDYGIVYGKDTYMIGIFTYQVNNAKELIEKTSKQILDLQEK